MNDQTQFTSRLEYSILDTEYFNIFMNSDFFFLSQNGNTKEENVFLSYVITMFMVCIYEYYLILSSILVRFWFTFPGRF